MSTNLASRSWFHLLNFYPPTRTNQTILRVASNALGSPLRQAFENAFNSQAFFVMGLDVDTDGGLPASRVPVSFTFGDHSGSHSEKYRLVLSPLVPTHQTMAPEDMPKTVEWVNAHYGEIETKQALLARGFTYELRLFHAGTNETDQPDYDYTLAVSHPQSIGIILDDPSSLLGEDNTSRYFAGEGKVVTLTVVDATFTADYNRDGIID